jgi:hypothetical protein
LQIQANNVVVKDANGVEVITIPYLDLDYHILYLLSGELIPSEIEINEAKIDLKDIIKESPNFFTIKPLLIFACFFTRLS